MRWGRLVLIVPIIALATCAEEDMFVQQRAVPWGIFPFFKNKMAMQQPVSGTVARNPANPPVPQPQTISEAMLERGHQRFDIYCAPCHGKSGDGQGMIVERSFPKPPVLFSQELIQAKAQHLYDVITNGKDEMFSYADRVSTADRWAIVAYIRALQRSQRARVASLSDEDKAHLQGAAP